MDEQEKFVFVCSQSKTILYIDLPLVPGTNLITTTITKEDSCYEQPNHPQTRRHNLFPKRSASRHQTGLISIWKRFTRIGSQWIKFRWNRFTKQQIGREQFIQFLLSRQQSLRMFALESQSQRLQSQRVEINWLRFGMVQFGWMYHSKRQSPTSYLALTVRYTGGIA